MNAGESSALTVGSSATYTQGNGVETGNPVLAEASNLNFTGGGAAMIHERGYYGHLSGNIAHGQTLAIEGCVGGGNPAIVSVAKSFENAGTIVLTSAKDNGSDCGGGDRTSQTRIGRDADEYRHDHDRSGYRRRTPARRPGDQQGDARHRRDDQRRRRLTTFTNEGDVNLATRRDSTSRARRRSRTTRAA